MVACYHNHHYMVVDNTPPSSNCGLSLCNIVRVITIINSVVIKYANIGVIRREDVIYRVQKGQQFKVILLQFLKYSKIENITSIF